MSENDTTTEANTAESDDGRDGNDGNDAEPAFEAAAYADGTVTYPPHPVGPNGAERVGSVDLRDREARVVTWTTSTATPPGVREPNTLAIVEFELDEGDGPPVRALGQVAADPDDPDGGTYDVAIGDRVEPVYADELREPGAGIREPESQSWDGFRFRPVE
ncbi:Zn-ribbon domain-containing OB-fold protein [Halorubrum halodurans]|uniref:Nucleic acid-binding protein n=1 Tax=Halorubrum halodurans TaxID=1383851 RepID=A0A256IIG2_9EURY|nr:OB-fold domain-containing protein [Halorubrum halodurans]OYR56319.1 hypothetical protein DJ70_09780 [Halorubrum halodurans]